MAWIVVALVGSALLFMPGLLEQFETPKIAGVRSCGLGALAFGLIAGHAGRPWRWTTLDRAVVAWLAVEILATALSVSPRVSLAGETREREGLITSLALVGLYFAARDAFAVPNQLNTVNGNNVFSYTQKEEQGGYLAGVAAGLMTKSNIIGMVAGQDYPDIVRTGVGFKEGVLSVNPKVKFLVMYTGDWVDVQKGYEAAKSMIESGARRTLALYRQCGERSSQSSPGS